ncbi:uncharacterized protein [Zea mays]|uniref:uncharacterized protein n=1 Tax=Zea mays TaxID=4577 RepID=UPI000C6C42E1|nr:uncharacterized protein LOC111589755 [Zea mays]|eukprot:XP_023156411.1 uncharacterized protein LOC111589755 [Zea mays]
MATVELMEEEEEDTSRLSELIALAEAGLRAQEEEDEFMSQAAEEVEVAYYKQKSDEAEAEDELFSQATDEVEANYYKRTVDKCDAGQCSKWNEVVVDDCATDDSEDELLIDCDSD